MGEPVEAEFSGRDGRLGRDLMNRGEMLAAKERFDAAFRSNGNAEALFLSAECWEKLGNGDEATLRYRQYLRLPLALRAAEATMRIHALEERKRENSRPGPGKPARYVLVPIATDRGACAEKCTAADVCPRRERKGAFDECLGNQFSCLQSCDGATVGMGVRTPARRRRFAGFPCSTSLADEHQTNLDDS